MSHAGSKLILSASGFITLARTRKLMDPAEQYNSGADDLAVEMPS
jgi:hypothetical protein